MVSGMFCFQRFWGGRGVRGEKIGDLGDALRQLGEDVSYLGNPGFPPLHIKPAQLKAGGRVQIRGNVSSQFLTALLMALPLTGVTTTEGNKRKQGSHLARGNKGHKRKQGSQEETSKGNKGHIL